MTRATIRFSIDSVNGIEDVQPACIKMATVCAPESVLTMRIGDCGSRCHLQNIQGAMEQQLREATGSLIVVLTFDTMDTFCRILMAASHNDNVKLVVDPDSREAAAPLAGDNLLCTTLKRRGFVDGNDTGSVRRCVTDAMPHILRVVRRGKDSQRIALQANGGIGRRRAARNKGTVAAAAAAGGPMQPSELALHLPVYLEVYLVHHVEARKTLYFVCKVPVRAEAAPKQLQLSRKRKRRVSVAAENDEHPAPVNVPHVYKLYAVDFSHVEQRFVQCVSPHALPPLHHEIIDGNWDKSSSLATYMLEKINQE